MATTTAPLPPAPLERPAEPFRHLGPNWHASVMGTAIVANGANALPVTVPGLHAAAVVVWALSFGLLLTVLAARAVHLVRHRAEARAQLLVNPATAVFYGCPPMAMLAVGFGTLVLGRDVVGAGAAVRIDALLWTMGTLYALAVAVGIPYLMITRHGVRAAAANPTWLLPVVAPMVAAALGPVLIPHLPHGGLQTALLYGCYAMFGGSLLATLAMLPLIVRALGRLPVGLTPALFLVLGPLGQSVTAVTQLAGAAPTVAPENAAAMESFALLYGVPVLGVAMLWLAFAGTANVRALRQGMPFAMTWWAYTFPVGTCVTGSAGLARLTDSDGVTGLAVGLYLLLVTAWAVAAVKTISGVRTGRLLRPAASVSYKTPVGA